MTFLTWNRPMTEIPASLIAFQRRFHDDDACAHDRGWQLKTKPHSFECARCHRQASVVASTLLHQTKLSLAVWSRPARPTCRSETRARLQGRGATPKARCLSPEQTNSAMATRRAACGWPRSRPAAPGISATSLCATPPRPRSSRQTAGAVAARRLGTATGPMSSATGRPMKFSPGSTPCFPTSRAARQTSPLLHLD